jgi:hypothetical protein
MIKAAAVAWWHGYGLDERGSNPSIGKVFLSSENIHNGSVVHPAF